MSRWSEVTFAVVWPVTPRQILSPSITATAYPACLSRNAVVMPVMPPPTTTTSVSRFPGRGGYDVSAVVSIQNDSCLPGRP